jgi:diguanylate cyclase (GGDEF)-like protein
VLGTGTSSAIALDIPTLFAVATCVTALLGVLLLFAWMQDRVRALAWWGCAYLIGGFSVAIWSVESYLPLPTGTSNALLFIACGMIWNAARLFHGRPVLWGALAAGATLWLIACQWPEFVESLPTRIVLSSFIIATYTFLTAVELWSERRKHLLKRWPAIFVPMLHGAVFLAPIPLASVLPDDRGVLSLASGWIAVFALEVMLYIVGTAFIVLVLAKERTVRIARDAASTDELTGLPNRRGFLQAAEMLVARQLQKQAPVSVLMFDLDHFKRINDRFGHAIGDAALRTFGTTASGNMRATDIVGRLGGEEFAAILPGTIEEAAIVAERVRLAFEAAGLVVEGAELRATVSIGAASGAPGSAVARLLARADAALYRAKATGRNRVVSGGEELDSMPVQAPQTPAVPAIDAEAVLAWHVEGRSVEAHAA